MKAEGNCPECDGTLGVEISDSIASMMGNTIRRMMNRDGNRMRCQNCDQFVDPDDITVHD